MFFTILYIAFILTLVISNAFYSKYLKEIIKYKLNLISNGKLTSKIDEDLLLSQPNFNYIFWFLMFLSSSLYHFLTRDYVNGCLSLLIFFILKSTFENQKQLSENVKKLNEMIMRVNRGESI